MLWSLLQCTQTPAPPVAINQSRKTIRLDSIDAPHCEPKSQTNLFTISPVAEFK